MPTYNRRRFVLRSIVYFKRQDYPNRELVILDDGTDPVRDMVGWDPQIRYYRIEGKCTVGYKRNLACQEAVGDLILHWDDDDWASHWRISYQVASLISSQSDICGLDRLLFYDLDGDQAWKYAYKGVSNWVYGGTLCYTKDFWNRNPFLDLRTGEDNHFVLNNPSARVLRLTNNHFYLGLIHRGNTSRKLTFGSYWHSASMDTVQNMTGADMRFYQPEPVEDNIGSPGQ